MFKDKKEYIVGKTLAKIVKLKAKIEKNFRKTELRMKNDGSNFWSVANWNWKAKNEKDWILKKIKK